MTAAAKIDLLFYLVALMVAMVTSETPCNPPPQSDMAAKYFQELSSDTGACGHHSFRSIYPLVELDTLLSRVANQTACSQDGNCGGAGEPPCALGCGDFSTADGQGALCPGSDPIPTSPNLESRSFCPWSYRMTDDDRRYPRILAEASCCYDNCLLGNDPSLPVCECKEVIRHIPILQYLRNETGICEYKMTSFPLPVGCTAASPYTTQQQ